MESTFNTDEEFKDYLLLLTLPDFLKICLEFFLFIYFFLLKGTCYPIVMTNLREKKTRLY